MGTGVTYARRRSSPDGESRWRAPEGPSFSLIGEPWIPVVLGDGTRREVGLRDALSCSREIERISSDSALTDTGILRLLVALTHRARAGPRNRAEWGALWDASSLLDSVLDEYLAGHADEFFLLDPTRPFGQTTVQRLEESGKTADEKSLAELQHLRATGTAKRLFDKSLDDEPAPWMLSQAARAVVTYQCWAPGGGQGYGSSRLVRRALVCFPLGASLHETVLLNTVAYDPSADEPVRVIDGDAPSWERDRRRDSISAERPVEGLVDLLTRRPRAVALLVDEGGLLGRVKIAAGERIPGSSDVRDPSLVYVLGKEGSATPVMAPRGAPVWRELPALLEARAGTGHQCSVLRWIATAVSDSAFVRLRIIALDSDHASTVLVSDAEVRLPARLADDPARRRAISGLVGSANAAHQALLKVYLRNLGKRGSRGDRRTDAKAHQSARAAAQERGGRVYWDGVARAFAQATAVLAEADVSSDDATELVQQWRGAIRQAVNDAVTAVDPISGAGVAALSDAGAARARLDSALASALASVVDLTDFKEDK